MIVREATPDDLPVAIDMIRQLWESHGEDDYDEVSLSDRCSDILRSCICYIVEHEGAPLAFASLQDQSDFMLIRHFAVQQTHRGRGLGRQAFQAIAAHAFPGRKSRLFASVSTPGPKQFWEKMGYHAFAYTMERKPEVAS